MKEINKMNENEIKEIAAQLRCPDGEIGNKVSDVMQETNASMVKATLELIEIKKENTLLEIGPGNGYHLEKIINQCKMIYTVDISKLMIDKINLKYNQYIDEKKLFTLLGDGNTINIDSSSIDKGFTVNTVYFWKEPKKYLDEIARCLKPGGEFLITYAHQNFMEKLPFTQYGFQFYNEEKIEQLCSGSFFSVKAQRYYKENISANLGEELEREFVVASLIKK